MLTLGNTQLSLVIDLGLGVVRGSRVRNVLMGRTHLENICHQILKLGSHLQGKCHYILKYVPI